MSGIQAQYSEISVEPIFLVSETQFQSVSILITKLLSLPRIRISYLNQLPRTPNVSTIGEPNCVY